MERAKSIYFLGIGGIGMSALAEYFLQNKCNVSGYDKVRTPLTISLENKGAQIHYEENIDLLPKDMDAVIYTPAIPKNHKEWDWIRTHQIPVFKRSEILGQIASRYKSVCVAGTHGKTTISTMIAHILAQSVLGTNAFLGGISKNFDSNFVLNLNSAWMVVEADEFDRSFLKLFPTVSVVSSLDADHLDIYGTVEELKKSFQDFVNQTDVDGVCFSKYGLGISAPSKFTYALFDSRADYYIQNLLVEDGMYKFDFHAPKGVVSQMQVCYPGLHNLENMVVAMAVALFCGVSEEEVKSAVFSFSGVKRRFDVRVNQKNCVYIDDYAHHPNEIKACLESVKSLYPAKKMTLVFQPHLFSRTRDFAKDFGEALSIADEVILLDIYPAREQPIEGIDSAYLKGLMSHKNVCLASKSNLLDLLRTRSIELLLTLGAGDIDTLVRPIEDMLLESSNLT